MRALIQAEEKELSVISQPGRPSEKKAIVRSVFSGAG